MSSVPKNLWPDDISASSAITPLSVLKGQAAALGPLTNNVVEATVSSAPIEDGSLRHAFT